MAKLKLTKTELKAQQDALKQYRRFLPTLQLKKQQLQLEMRTSRKHLEANRAEYESLNRKLAAWVSLYGDPAAIAQIQAVLKVTGVIKGRSNIAGVSVPVFERVEFAVAKYDLFLTELWLDGGIQAVRGLIEVLEAKRVLEEQYELLSNELRTTTQRVNLFEKVKIPECIDNIRKINIYINDDQTAAVVRSKIVKRKMAAAEAAARSDESKEAVA